MFILRLVKMMERRRIEMIGRMGNMKNIDDYKNNIYCLVEGMEN